MKVLQESGGTRKILNIKDNFGKIKLLNGITAFKMTKDLVYDGEKSKFSRFFNSFYLKKRKINPFLNPVV